MITYNVRVWKIAKHKRARGWSYEVRWSVASSRKSKSFNTRGLAEAFRAKLITAAREGEPFDTGTGLPVSMARPPTPSRTWYEHACEFVDTKWPRAAAKTRRANADALATATRGLLDTAPGMPQEQVVQEALYKWAFNTSARRASGPPPARLDEAVRWVERHSLPLDQLKEPQVLRRVLDHLALKADGTAAAANTVSRKRAVLHSALEYAVELGHLDANPLATVKWQPPPSAETVDRRVVANPEQARALLEAVEKIDPSGPRLVAFFGCMYYSALRPAEVVQLRQQDCVLPAEGWGELHLASSAPRLGRSWTDKGTTHDERQLKHRSRDEVRQVPAPPDLVTLLRRHLAQFGASPDGYLFRSRRGRALSESVYGRVWSKARTLALTSDQIQSPLARRPYDLRHAAVSLWLNAGVSAQQVAQWAGNSVSVLLRVYAKCLDGEADAARRRIERGLRDEGE